MTANNSVITKPKITTHAETKQTFTLDNITGSYPAYPGKPCMNISFKYALINHKSQKLCQTHMQTHVYIGHTYVRHAERYSIPQSN